MTSQDAFSPRPDAAAPETVDLDCLRGGLRILCLRALGNVDDAEEAVQETLARAVEALREGHLGDSAKLAAYVAGIARHVCSHTRRDEKRTVSLDDLPSAAGPTVLVDPLESLITAAESERLNEALDSLSSTDQRLLRLCYFEEQTPAEVADALGEPGDRVRKRKQRALERLRHAFLGEGHEGGASGTKGSEGETSTGQQQARKEQRS